MKKPSSRKSTGASSSDDEVRHSLDVLDSVIGEFDDGLTSAAESDSGLIEAEIRKRPPPKRQNVVNPPEMMSSGLSLTDKIDDIFSELTEEIYSADKQQKIIHRAPMRTESTNSSNNARKLSPIRRVNDPLPTPPQLQETSRKTGAKDEVVVYGEKERPKEVIALKKSVKAQVHSLETRGRHHRIITPASTPAQNNEQNKSTFTKNTSVNNNNRSRSENPPKAGGRGVDHRTSKTKNGNGLSLPAKDDFASRVNPDRINKKSGQRNQAPPMPEKTKIHLKSSEKSAKKTDKRQRRPDQPLPDLPSSLEPSSLPSSHPYEVLPQEPSKREKDKAKADAYRRSKSVGPVVEAAQRELLFNAARDRSRSRGPPGAVSGPEKQPQSELKRSKSKSRLYEEESNSSSGRGAGRAFRNKENTSLESSRGRSRIKNNVERSVSTSKKIDVMDPFLSALPSRAMPARQKSMIDLRDPHLEMNLHHHHNHIPSHHHRHFMQNTPPRQVNHLMNSPQNLQQQPAPQQRPRMMRSATEHEIKVRNRRSMAVGPLEDLPPHIRQHMVRQHGLRMPPTGEPALDPAANNFMFSGANRRPLSARDRQMAEEDALLMRQLTLDSQREFLVRRGFSQNHPYISGEVPIHPELQGRLPFHVPSRTIPMRPDDYQRFKPEYWLQNHNGTPNPVAFTDLAVLQNELELKRRRELHRQNSQKHNARQQQQENPNHQNQHIENNFNSLPWEEIIPRRIGGVPVLPAAEQELRNRSKSQDPRKPRGNLFSHLSGSGWFNPGHVWREAEPDVRGLGAGNVKQQGHWLLKERDNMVSMPPNIDTLRDSGIGLALPEEHSNLQRNEPKRSSFGMALKDKFNKNPNMYFPGPGSQDGSQKSHRSKTNSPTKTHTSIEEDISDTDTLIHNMSEGSYEKDGGSSEDHESFGSAKGSRSSGNSSLSPHNSMEGSPRMLQSQSMQFQPNSGPSSSVNLMGNKKTIRNYTPKESSNMLREFEDRRNTNSHDYRGGKNPRSKNRLERKSSVERMIDDFHRNLPPPGVENRQQNTEQNTVGSAQTNATNTTENSTKKASKSGTMNSQISNWSAASSAASFDYQPAGGLKKYKSTDLPSLDEDPDDDIDEPDFERVPPEGMAASVKGQSPTNFSNSPTNFVQRIEVKNHRRSPSPSKQKSRKTREELLPPPPPPPPPMPEVEAEDEFSNLRKLISEGRIAGLNEKPPSFIPPSPPSSPKKEDLKRRPSSAKPPAPSTPKTPKSSHSVERGPSKKNPAPKPPTNSSNVSTPSSEVKFVSSRAREPSLEDLTQMSNKKRNEVKRSSSNHGTRPSGFQVDHHVNGDTTTAQLIADSTEKKFNFNPFKGKKLFKKKQYSFDFN